MVIFVPVTLSLLAIVALVRQDPRRAKIFGVTPRTSVVSSRVLWIICVAPGLILMVCAPLADWIIWFGTTVAAGWFIAFLPPGTGAQVSQHLAALEHRFVTRKKP